MLIFISTTLLRQGVCVCTICIDVKLLNSRGATAHLPMLPNEATEDAVEGFMDA